jgi:hypothetical protein
MLEYGDVAVDIHVLLLKNRKTEVKDGIPWRSCFSCQGHVKMSKLLAGFPSFSKNTLNPIVYNVYVYYIQIFVYIYIPLNPITSH